MYTDPATKFTECETGEVRFSNYTDNQEEGSRRGTLQLCVNNAWGTVCSDNLFDTTDAEVFCNQLEGFNATGENYFKYCKLKHSACFEFMNALFFITRCKA